MRVALGERSLLWIHKQICESPMMDWIGPPTIEEMEDLWAMMDIEDTIVVAINEDRYMSMAFSMLVAKTEWDSSRRVRHAFGGDETRCSYKVIESGSNQEAR